MSADPGAGAIAVAVDPEGAIGDRVLTITAGAGALVRRDVDASGARWPVAVWIGESNAGRHDRRRLDVAAAGITPASGTLIGG
jgi:hypothetical protein